ncbi:MAG: hypothetical protein FVQ82_03440 [Planctomycetes bacterium]|nr:hypothetical protein [Planctomycetota bacterium]
MKKKWNRNGSVLLVVVFAIALLTTLVTGMLQMNTEELMLMQNQVSAAETLAIANAGLNDAFAELRSNSSWNSGFTDKSFSDGTYTVTVSGTLPSLTVESTSLLNGFTARLAADMTVSTASPYVIRIDQLRINE